MEEGVGEGRGGRVEERIEEAMWPEGEERDRETTTTTITMSAVCISTTFSALYRQQSSLVSISTKTTALCGSCNRMTFLTESLLEAVLLLLVPVRRCLQMENLPAAGVQAHVLAEPSTRRRLDDSGGVGRGGREEPVGRF